MTLSRSAHRSRPKAVAPGRLLLRLSGRFESAEGNGCDLEPKDALLLAYLALEGPTPRARLAALLWPDVEEERARGNLRQRLLRLKRTTGEELVIGSTSAALADGITHDLEAASELLADIDVHVATGLAEWLEAQREQRRRVRLEALAVFAERAEAERDLESALESAQALVQLDPLSEHAHRRVMRLHYLRGDSGAAMAAYERCRQTLKRELNAVPSADTDALRATVAAGAPGTTAVALRRVPAAVLRPPRLIGRNTEWGALQAAWGAGEAAFVLGEAGLGKTRLLTDFARAAGRTVVVSARPGDERVVYALTTRLLRQLPREVLAALDAGLRKELARLLPELGEAEPIRSEAERARFFNAVAAALAAGHGLAGVAVDDLHFADEASVELIQYLGAERSLRWLFAGRPAELGAAARALLDAVRARPRGVIELAPLTLEQMTELLASLDLEGIDTAEMASALLRHTGGNPLFALETIKAWLSQGGGAQRLPAVAQVGALIERRIGRLSPEAVKLARCAAVAGQDFSAELTAQVLGVRPLDLVDPWAELEAAQVLRDGAFAHDLIHEAALASVPTPIAQHLHREVATFLSQRGNAPGREATHWLAAGDELLALPALLRSAVQSEQAMRLHDCCEAYLRAADIAERHGHRDIVYAACKGVIEATLIADRSALDFEILDRMEANAGSERERAQTRIRRAGALFDTGKHGEAIAVAARAAEAARNCGAEDLRVEALSLVASAATLEGDSELAVRTLRPVLPWVMQHASVEQQTEFYGDFAACLDNADQQAEAQEFHRRAIQLALTTGRFDHAVTAHANLAVSFIDTGHPSAARESLHEAVRLGQAYDAAAGVGWFVRLLESATLRDLRRYGEAIAVGEAAWSDVRHHTGGQAALHVNFACLWIHLGQPARAERELKAVQALTDVSGWILARAQQMRGRSLWTQGRGSDAATHWCKAAELAASSGRSVLKAMIDLDRSLAMPAEVALRSVDEIERQAQRLGQHGTALAARARALGAAVRVGDAAAARRRVAEERMGPSDVEPNDMYRLELHLATASALALAGDAAGARQVAQAGVELVQAAADVHVPSEFRDSFLNRNPFNRELIRLAMRLK